MFPSLPEDPDVSSATRRTGDPLAACELRPDRVTRGSMFVFFSNRLGCLGSIAVSLVVTALLLLVLGVLDF